MSVTGGSGFSSYSESLPRPILRSGPRDHGPRYSIREASHRDCGYRGPAEHLEAPGYESFDCPKDLGGCGAVVVLWDDGTVEDDVQIVEAHVDPDWLDGPPESATERGVA